MKNTFFRSYHLLLSLLLVCAFACQPGNKSASREKENENTSEIQSQSKPELEAQYTPETKVETKVENQPGKKADFQKIKTAFINPPFPGLQPAFTKVKVQAEKGGKVSFPGGTSIVFPANGFLDESGNPVKGEVEVLYREYHDAVDVLLSGIPMSYDSAGVKYTLQTAGMFDLQAQQQSKPLQWDATKKIKVNMVSFVKDNDYSFYKLDTVKKNWIYRGTFPVTPKKQMAGTAAGNVEKAAAGNQKKKVFSDRSFFFGTTQEYDHDSVLMEKNLRNAGIRNFKLRKSSITYAYHGDALFAHMIWELEKGKQWPVLDSNQVVSIKLTKADHERVSCRIWDKSEKLIFEAYIKSVKAVYNAFPEIRSRRFWKIYTFEEMQKFKTYEQTQEVKTYLDAEQVVRRFEIEGFGVYNFDRILETQQHIQVKGNFITSENATLNCIHLILKNENAVIAYYPEQWNYMRLATDSEACFFAILPGPYLAVFSKEEYQKIDFEKLRKTPRPEYTFSMTIHPQKVSSAKEVRKILGIKSRI